MSWHYTSVRTKSGFLTVTKDEMLRMRQDRDGDFMMPAADREDALRVAMDAELTGRLEQAEAIRAELMPLSALEQMLGKTMTRVVRSRGLESEESIEFTADNGWRWRMHHDPSEYARVFIDDIVGDLSDLEGSPIVAEEAFSSESSHSRLPPQAVDDESYTWTFYKFATGKGYVTIRWYGTSNGYYSERARIIRVSPDGEELDVD